MKEIERESIGWGCCVKAIINMKNENKRNDDQKQYQSKRQ